MTDSSKNSGVPALAYLLGVTTVLHFATPKPIDYMIPPEIPGPPRAWTYGSGVAELVVAGLLAAPQTRRIGGAAAAVLFAAVFPGNVQLVRQFKDKPFALRAAAIARLPLQYPLISHALKIRNAN